MCAHIFSLNWTNGNFSFLYLGFFFPDWNPQDEERQSSAHLIWETSHFFYSVLKQFREMRKNIWQHNTSTDYLFPISHFFDWRNLLTVTSFSNMMVWKTYCYKFRSFECIFKKYFHSTFGECNFLCPSYVIFNSTMTLTENW